MQIKEIRLFNIQGFVDAKLELSKSINVIVGKNNTGKSTIIRSLLNFQNSYYGKSDQLLRKFETNGFIIASFSGSIPLRTLKKYPHDETPSLVYDAGNGKHWQLPTSSTIPGDSHELPQYFAKVKNDGELLDNSPFPDSEPNNHFLPFLAKRKTSSISGQFDATSMRKVDEDFRNLATKLSRATSNTYSEEFKKACEEIIDFVPATVPNQPNINLSTIAQYISEVDTISIEQMGDGVTQAIGLLVYLFQSKGKIFLIEEIENDLHPDSLKKLLKYLISASEFNQFIVTTHSNIVVRMLGELSDTSIFETKSELIKDPINKRSLFRSNVSKVQNTVQERIRLLSDLGYELADFHLWSGFLILEESSAELLIRAFLIPAFCPSLVNRLRTVAATGAADVLPKFSHFKTLFTFIHVSEVYRKRAWVFVDNDKEGNSVLDKLRDAHKTWNAGHFIAFAKPDFEDYYPEQYRHQIEEILLAKQMNKNVGKMKLDLAKSVVRDYERSPSEIVRAFAESANDVITKLRAVEDCLLEQM